MPELTSPEFTYTVSKDAGNHTVIGGKNGGNIRGKGGKWVEWNALGGTLTITVTEFLENDDPSTSLPIPLDEAFESPPASVEVSGFRAKLIKLTRGEPLRVFKYTVTATGATPLDPLIIVDR